MPPQVQSEICQPDDDDELLSTTSTSSSSRYCRRLSELDDDNDDSSSSSSDGENDYSGSALHNAGPQHSSSSSKNLSLMLIYTLLNFAGRSIWNQNVLATFAYLLKDGDPKAVGVLTAAMGFVQLVTCLPSGILADKYRRDSLLKVSSIVGCVATGTTLMALHQASYNSLLLALCVWGLYWGSSSSSGAALFADSIEDGKRAYYFTLRSILINTGNLMGPIVTLVMFACLGDEWTLRDCTIVMAVGQILCLPALVILWWLDDDASIRHHQAADNNNNTAAATAVRTPNADFEASLTSPLLEPEEDNDDNTSLVNDFNEDCEAPPPPSQELQFSNDNRQHTTSSRQRGHRSSNRKVHRDETYDAQKLASWLGGGCCSIIPQHRLVPVLVMSADIGAGLAEGMTFRYLAIFLVQNLNLGPVLVQIVYVVVPILLASLMKFSQIGAKRVGRCRIAVVQKWIGILLTWAMIVAYRQDQSTWLVCTLLVARVAFLGSTSALTRSVLMDHVPPSERAKWSALESVNVFSWSGTAALGGILVDQHGIIFNFGVSAICQFVATLPLLLLSLAGSPTRDRAWTSTTGNISNHDEEEGCQ